MRTTRQLLEELPERLAPVFRRYPDVLAVYLFGSAAAGRMRPDSDIDLAVVPRTPALRRRKLDLLADLVKAGFCNVDLVFLDTDDVVLKHEAVRLNRVVYQTDDFDRGEMFARVLGEYQDFLPHLKVQREAYKRRALRGQD